MIEPSEAAWARFGALAVAAEEQLRRQLSQQAAEELPAAA